MTDSESGDRGGGPRRVVGAPTRKIDVVSDRIDSRDLFVGTREIIIGHGEDAYRLRLTSQNKLILTK